MVYINQFQNLIQKGVEQNKEFLRLIWDAQLTDEEREFYTMRGMRRQRESMTLDRFLELMGDDTYAVLVIGARHPEQLTYGAVAREHRARIAAPYTDSNFQEIAKAYASAFGTQLNDEPVEEWVLENYRKLVRAGIR